MPATVTSAAACAAAVWLLVPPPAGALRLVDATTASRQGRALRMLPVAAMAGALLVLVEGVTLALGLVLLGGLWGATRLVMKVRRRKAAGLTADRVVEVCEALAGELRAGQPPVRALRDCVEVWAPLASAATAAELDGDVVGALRRLARLPGAAGLAEVAAAWQVAQRAGGSMAPALGHVAEAVRRRRTTDRLVGSELASARATARLVAVLPMAVLAMGSSLGGDPWAFLLGTATGVGCLGAGVLLAYVGLTWIERIATEVEE